MSKTCAICLDRILSSKDAMRLFECTHNDQFHETCAIKWILSPPSTTDLRWMSSKAPKARPCPICRARACVRWLHVVIDYVDERPWRHETSRDPRHETPRDEQPSPSPSPSQEHEIHTTTYLCLMMLVCSLSTLLTFFFTAGANMVIRRLFL